MRLLLELHRRFAYEPQAAIHYSVSHWSTLELCGCDVGSSAKHLRKVRVYGRAMADWDLPL